MSNFVIIKKGQFETYLPDGFQPIQTNAKEYVYQGTTENANVGIRVYSSVDIRTNETRDVGADAVRIVFWDIINDRPLGKGKRIYRVESKTSIGDRINQRIKDFMKDAYNQTVIDFGYVRAILNSNAVNWQGFAKSLLEGLEKYGSLTDNQLAYVLGEKNPKGKPTFEATVKIKDPDFLQKYLDSLDEDVDEIETDIENFEAAKQDEEPAIDEPKGSIENVDINNQIATSEYKPYQYPFESFNPVQSEVLPKVDEDKNIIIGASTSSGKTICAELMIDPVISKHKIIYTSPLKSLSTEKYMDWQKRYDDKKIIMLTGDTLYNATERKKQMAEAAKSDIIILTSELLDSVTRKMESEKNFWLKSVGLMITDESHGLTLADRGHAIETGIMRFTSFNKNAKILFLSATMPNVDQLGKWLTTLNGKETNVIYSTWRPVQLEINYIEYDPAINSRGREDYWETQDRKRNKAIEIVLSKPDEKFLIFCHDKGTGRNIVTRLKKEGIDSRFHNADLDYQDRIETENSFQDKEGGIRILVSTSTLAYGRNLPARNVIIVGVHRGIKEVDELDIIQEIGRSGRVGLDNAGFVYLIIPAGSTNIWKETLTNPKPVNSVLNNRSVLGFHVLAEIQNRVITNEGSLLSWYKRSLAGMQNLIPFEKIDAENLINDLIQTEMLIGDYSRLSITGLGKVSAWLYFPPEDIYAWYMNFSKIFGNILKDQKSTVVLSDETLAWAIADIPSNDLGYIRSNLRVECDNWKWTLKNRGINATDALPSVIGAYNCLMGIDDDLFGIYKRAVIYDIQRQTQAFELIDGMHAKWNKEKFWKTLPMRIKYGIDEDLIELVQIPGIGGVRAKKLWEAGFRSVMDVANPERKNALRSVLKINVNQIQSAAKKLLGERKED